MLVGKKMTALVERDNTVKALLGYIGTCNKLNFDYLQNKEVGLTILHYLFFQDTGTEIFYNHSKTFLKNIVSTSCQVKKTGEGTEDLNFQSISTQFIFI